MVDDATKLVWLGEAETALHQLLTGTKVVKVGYAGGETTYAATPDGISQLRAYITQLKSELGLGEETGRVVMGADF